MRLTGFMSKTLLVVCLTFVFLAASSIGLCYGLNVFQKNKTELPQLPVEPQFSFLGTVMERGNTPLENVFDRLNASITQLALKSGVLTDTIAAEKQRDEQLIAELAALAQSVSSNKNLSDTAYETMIVNRLGTSVYSASGNNSEILIFELKNEDLRGYMAKIKLKTSSALKIAMAPANASSGETTSQAAKRYDAKFAVNGGGFAWGTVDGQQKLLPIGNTMIDGKLVGDFQPSWNDLAFIGFTKQNKLVGGVYAKETELKSSGAYQGVSFVPMLIHDWEPVAIPSQWANQKQPRTVMGQYPNGDIFFIVVDGRQSSWSNGITLEEMQVLLMRLGVMEAYNLDGGGSSAMYYNGSILNKPSDGSERKLATNILIMP